MTQTLNHTIRANLATEREMAIVHIASLTDRLASAQNRLEYLNGEIEAVDARIRVESRIDWAAA